MTDERPWRALGERLRAGRAAMGLTQARLAGQLGIDQSTVSTNEQGRSRPGRTRLAAYAALLQLDAEELLALAGYARPGDSGGESAAATAVGRQCGNPDEPGEAGRGRGC